MLTDWLTNLTCLWSYRVLTLVLCLSCVHHWQASWRQPPIRMTVLVVVVDVMLNDEPNRLVVHPGWWLIITGQQRCSSGDGGGWCYTGLLQFHHYLCWCVVGGTCRDCDGGVTISAGCLSMTVLQPTVHWVVAGRCQSLGRRSQKLRRHRYELPDRQRHWERSGEGS